MMNKSQILVKSHLSLLKDKFSLIRGTIKSSVAILLLLLFVMVITRVIVPERSMDDTGPRAIINEGFALGLLFVIALLSVAIGEKILRLLKIHDVSTIERTVYQTALGLGFLAYGVLALGLMGWLDPRAIVGFLVLCGLWTWNELTDSLTNLIRWLKNLWQIYYAYRYSYGIWEIFAGVMVAMLLVFGIARALTPVTDYDGLMYHLQGPKYFLQAKQLRIIPDMLQANSPFTVDMLFTIGLAFHSDILAKLIHLLFAILLTIFTYTLGKRILGNRGGAFAVLIFLGTPILPNLASSALVDLPWSLYEILAITTLILWFEKDDQKWLVLAGFYGGLSLGVKYNSIGSVGVMVSLVVLFSLRKGLKKSFLNGVLFGCTALLIGSPWYLKNLIWAGNPVYPMVFGGLEWPMSRVKILTDHLLSFGNGRGFIELISLPWKIFFKPEKYADGTIGLFPLYGCIFMAPFFKMNRGVAFLGVWTLLRFIVWSTGYHVIRHLLPLFPLFSVLAAWVLIRMLEKTHSNRVLMGLINFMVLFGLAYSTSIFSIYTVFGDTFPVLLGVLSKNQYIAGRVKNHHTIQYINSQLADDAQVFMMWDGRGYYCDRKCLPNADQSKWTWLATTYPDNQSLANHLRELGVTHLMLSLGDAIHFTHQDISGKQLQALNFFLYSFRLECAKLIFQDIPDEKEEYSLYELTCPK